LKFFHIKTPRKRSGLGNCESPVDRTVAHLNIEHYRRLLEQETDEAKRKTLLQLLAEEEAKLQRTMEKRDPAA
jgi:hypothetical protein